MIIAEEPGDNITYDPRSPRRCVIAAEPNGLLAKVGAARERLERARGVAGLARARFEASIVEAARTGAPQRAIATSARVSQPFVSQVVAANRGRFVPTSELGYLLASRRSEVQRITAAYRCGDVAVFGSVARGEDRPGSDIDLLVEIPEDMGPLTMARMEQEIADTIGAPVDVAPARLLKPEVRGTADLDAVPL